MSEGTNYVDRYNQNEDRPGNAMPKDNVFPPPPSASTRGANARNRSGGPTPTDKPANADTLSDMVSVSNTGANTGGNVEKKGDIPNTMRRNDEPVRSESMGASADDAIDRGNNMDTMDTMGSTEGGTRTSGIGDTARRAKDTVQRMTQSVADRTPSMVNQTMERAKQVGSQARRMREGYEDFQERTGLPVGPQVLGILAGAMAGLLGLIAVIRLLSRSGNHEDDDRRAIAEIPLNTLPTGRYIITRIEE